MTPSATPQSWESFFDFAPQPSQDADLLRQLSFVPGLKELLTVRQVHALEHATVWVLSEMLQPTLANSGERADAGLGGMSTDRGFYLYGSVSPSDLQRAVRTALHRLVSGEWDLAVHPRCGTNLSVGLMLTATMALGVYFLIPKGPIAQMAGLGAAAIAASQLTPDVGNTMQRYVTTAIPFNLEVEGISHSTDQWGHPVHFVRVRWKD